MVTRMRRGRRPSHDHLALLVEELPSSFVWTADVDLRLTSLAGAALHLLGVDDPATLLGEELATVVAQATQGGAVIVDAHRRALGGDTVNFTEGSRHWAFDVHV